MQRHLSIAKLGSDSACACCSRLGACLTQPSDQDSGTSSIQTQDKRGLTMWSVCHGISPVSRIRIRIENCDFAECDSDTKTRFSALS